jgi:hypothetical protein
VGSGVFGYARGLLSNWQFCRDGGNLSGAKMIGEIIFLGLMLGFLSIWFIIIAQQDAKTLKNILIIFGFAIILMVLLSMLVILCFGGFLFLALIPQEYPIAEVELANNQTLKIWYETSVNDDGAGLHYYRISQGNKVIHPVTEIGWLYYNYRADYKVAFCQDKTLVCIYDSTSKYGFFFLYNTENGELWTHRPTDDQETWEVYYDQLKAENPDLPDRFFFED